MTERRKATRRFVVRIKNEGYEASLERNKIYVMERDPEAEKDGDVRIIDESGEDYLYPADWFVAVEVPKAVRASLLTVARGAFERGHRLVGAESRGARSDEARDVRGRAERA